MTSDAAQTAMREAVEHIEQEIANLRSIITELRPAALDELGLAHGDRGAARPPSRAERIRDRPRAGAVAALPRSRDSSEDLETAVYRLVQEALTNVAKHARADVVRVAVTEADGELLIEVQDDGAGFDPDLATRRLRPRGHARAGGSRRRHAEHRLRRSTGRC